MDSVKPLIYRGLRFLKIMEGGIKIYLQKWTNHVGVCLIEEQGGRGGALIFINNV